MLYGSEAKATPQAENIVPFRPRAAQAPVPRHWSMRIAASVAVLAAAAGGYAIGLSSSPTQPAWTIAVGSDVPAALSSLLSTQPSGTEPALDGASLKLVASVKTPDGTLCREFEIDSHTNRQTMMGVACRADRTWRLDIAVAAPADDSGFAPASSQDALSNYLDAIGAGAALDAEQEKRELQ
jgi:hypothetical protein